MDEAKKSKSEEGRRWRIFKMENIRSSSNSRAHGKRERSQKPDESLCAPRDWGMEFLPTLQDLQSNANDKWS